MEGEEDIKKVLDNSGVEVQKEAVLAAAADKRIQDVVVGDDLSKLATWQEMLE